MHITHTPIRSIRPIGAKSYRQKTSVNAIIYADSLDETYDDGLGGVRLAKESAIVMSGTVKSSGPMFTDLKRYTETTLCDSSAIPSIMKDAGVTLICSGTGAEVYQDPGEGTERIVILAPSDAANNALASRTKESLHTAKKIFINFIGGDDLMAHEVIDGVDRVVQGLDINSSSKVTFHSLCHTDFPLEKASVTVLALHSHTADTTSSSNMVESIKRGELYFHEGKWWTTLEENVNTNLA
jgi:hypothetical protein